MISCYNKKSPVDILKIKTNDKSPELLQKMKTVKLYKEKLGDYDKRPYGKIEDEKTIKETFNLIQGSLAIVPASTTCSKASRTSSITSPRWTSPLILFMTAHSLYISNFTFTIICNIY
jgi:hypothetical protein